MTTESTPSAGAGRQHEHESMGMPSGQLVGGEHAGGAMDGDRQERLRAHHTKVLWTYVATILLGVWLLTSPATFGYHSAPLAWSDGVSGALLVALGMLALSPRRIWAQWMVGAVGA